MAEPITNKEREAVVLAAHQQAGAVLAAALYRSGMRPHEVDAVLEVPKGTTKRRLVTLMDGGSINLRDLAVTMHAMGMRLDFSLSKREPAPPAPTEESPVD